MKFKIMTALIALFLLVNFSVSAIATMPLPPRYTSTGDYYQVVFDGESEASVLAKFVRMNTGNGTVDEIVFEIPGNVIMKYMFQEIHNKTCNDFGCYTDWMGTYAPLSYSSEELSKSVKYTVKLNKVIEPGETGTIILYYKAMGYVDSVINYNFDFETAKSPTDIEYTRVAISVDSDLYLRGGSTSVDYKSNFGGFEAAAKMSSSGMVTGEYASQIRGYSQNIQYASGYVKEKRNLDPWESFHVKGVYNYSELSFLTYLTEISVGLILLVAARIFLWDKIKNAFAETGFFAKRKEAESYGRRREGRFSRIAIAGFVSAVALLVVWWLFFSFLLNFVSYFDWRLQSFSILFMLMGVVLSIVVFVLPSILIGKRYGTTDGVLTMVASIVWVILILSAIFLLFGYREPVYILGAAATEIVK
ncbi:MAG: hypothetical protein HYW24_04175 [Candidatus Aenigmarchaeota archaeon]|nr:hypothetical protein [Candidatus Aenigmarchaeota archaeon]